MGREVLPEFLNSFLQEKPWKKNSEHKSLEDVFGPVVASYSRAQAIEDGVLIDVTAMAREAGFKWPVALTHTAWCDCVAWTGRITAFSAPGRVWPFVGRAVYGVLRHSNGYCSW